MWIFGCPAECVRDFLGKTAYNIQKYQTKDDMNFCFWLCGCPTVAQSLYVDFQFRLYIISKNIILNIALILNIWNFVYNSEKKLRWLNLFYFCEINDFPLLILMSLSMMTLLLQTNQKFPLWKLWDGCNYKRIRLQWVFQNLWANSIYQAGSIMRMAYKFKNARNSMHTRSRDGYQTTWSSAE